MEKQVMRLADIAPASYNPRVKLTDKDHEYRALRASIDEFGYVVPMIVNTRTGNLVSGHQRLEVLLKNGVEEAEVVIVDMELEKEKALNIALNKVDGQWDYGKLADILEELSVDGEDILATGFTDGEIADLIGEIDAAGDADAEIPDVEMTERKDNTKNGIPCRIGEYDFKIEKPDFEDMMADVREKVGFSKEQVCKELERRIFG